MHRYIYLLLIGAVVSIAAYGQERVVKLTKGNHPIKEILTAIQDQSDVIIFYSDDVVLDQMTYTVKTSRMHLDQLFSEMLRPHDLDVKHMGNKVFAIFASTMPTMSSTREAIEGHVIDSLGRPIEFANIRLFDQHNRLMAISSTDSSGTFYLRERVRENERYQIQVSALGYEAQYIDFTHPLVDALQHIVLHANYIQLQSVDIRAQRPPFERVADRLIVQVEGSTLENGLSTLEILQRSPGLWVDPSGNIRLRGNQSVQVMINDILQRMSGEQLAEYLRNLPSESISKIEIIPNPAAEYEASGTAGIIRIVLRRNILDGFRANLMARYFQQEKDPYYNIGTITDFKKDKLFLTAVAGYLRNDEYIYASNDVTYADQTAYTSFTDRYRQSKTYNGRVTAIYDLSDRQRLGLQSVIAVNHTDQDFLTDNTHFRKQDTVFKNTYNNWLTSPTQFSSTLNYVWERDSIGSSLKVLADYVHTQHREENHYTMEDKTNFNSEQYINYSPHDTRIYSLQTDWIQQYASAFNWLGGVKFTGTQRDNEVLRQNRVNTDWVKDENLSNQFLYNENLLMGYLAINYKKDKSAAKIGIRAEQTYVHARSLTTGDRIALDYLHIFPSVYLQREIGNRNSIFLNYAKRINRPSFKNLNPYTLQIDDFILLQGNADLKPEIAHRVEAGIQLQNNSAIDIFYTYNRDKMALFTETIDNKVLVYQTRNFPNSKDFGASMFVPWKLYSWWSGQVNATWYKHIFDMQDLVLDQQTFELSAGQFWKVKKWFDASLYLSYSSPYISANTRYADQFFSTISLSRRVAKDKGKITLHVNDVFNTFREREWTSRNGTYIDFYQKRPTRTFGISFTYMLSTGKKMDDKKVEEGTREVKSRAN